MQSHADTARNHMDQDRFSYYGEELDRQTEYERVSVFSRVYDTFRYLGEARPADSEMDPADEDSFVRQKDAEIGNYTLRARDFFLYLIGLLVRIQTFMIGYILFAVDTQNTCVVSYDSEVPLPREMIPEDRSLLPGGFADMSKVFEAIIMMLFITSICTSIFYVNKVIAVIKHHRSSREVYVEKALPAVRLYKIWNTLFGLSHLACFFIFLRWFFLWLRY